MSDAMKTRKMHLQLDDLELNKETIQDLTEQVTDQARGGARPQTGACGNQCTEAETGCL